MKLRKNTKLNLRRETLAGLSDVEGAAWPVPTNPCSYINSCNSCLNASCSCGTCPR